VGGGNGLSSSVDGGGNLMRKVAFDVDLWSNRDQPPHDCRSESDRLACGNGGRCGELGALLATLVAALLLRVLVAERRREREIMGQL
jgi:hypothetical protein